MKPVTCIDGSCNMAGVEIYPGKNTKCAECGGELIDFDNVEVVSSDDGHGMTEAEQQQAVLEFIEGPQNGNSAGSGFFLVQHTSGDTFTCEADLTGCPIAKDTVSVSIPQKIFYQWIAMARKFDTEWIAYVYGEETAPSKWLITGFYIPKQRANVAHCDAEDGEIRPGTIASVHSHVDMMAFFSGEDQKHFNHTIEMVVNRKGDIKANVRSRLECGRFHRGEAKITIMPPEEDVALFDELNEKLTKETHAVIWTQPAMPNHSHGRSAFSTPSQKELKRLEKEFRKRNKRSPEELRKESERLAMGPHKN